jgi:hypothetical protein
MRECLEEGIIQAYVDGELAPEASERVRLHTNACAACAALVAETENELALLATTFEPELSLPVPSERLRERLDAAILDIRTQQAASANTTSWNLKGWLSSLAASFNFAPRQAMGFASLVAVIAFAAIFAIVASRRTVNQPLLADSVSVPQETIAQAPAATEVKPPPDAETINNNPENGTNIVKPVAFKPRRASLPVRAPRPKVERVERIDSPQVAEVKPLPGEESYLKTIASLSSIIKTNGENALKPSLRADYERNLALVDQAINATRQAARRNPKDPNAAEFLYSSYQSKIDLLSTVAEHGQMVAIAR